MKLQKNNLPKNKQNAYMKGYRKRKKNNESQSEKLARQRKQNMYMKEYNRRKKNIETATKKLATEVKQITNMMKDNETRCFCEAYTGLPVVRVTENQKALNCVVLNYSIPVSQE